MPHAIVHRRLSRLACACALVLLAALALAARASAFDGSSITSPTDQSYFGYADSAPTTMTVTGTVTNAGAGDTADIVCVGSSTGALATDVDVSSGSFSVTRDLASISERACRLHAIPHGASPTGDLSAYTGPRVSIGGSEQTIDNGVLVDTYDYALGFAGSYDSDSLGECAINTSFVYDPATFSKQPFLYCNSWLSGSDGNGRSELRVDGQDAYMPGQWSEFSGVDLSSLPGFQPLTSHTTFDTASGTMTKVETDVAMACNTATFPPTSASCTSLHTLGVRLDETITVLANGLVARVLDTVSSTDGHSHAVDTEWEQDFEGLGAGMRFPGESGYSQHSIGDTFSNFPAGPSTIGAINNQASAPSVTNPVGSISYSRPPTTARFIYRNEFLMHYADTVTPSAPATWRWGFADAGDQATADALAPGELDFVGVPTVSIDSPGSGATVSTASVVVSGHAADNVGVTALSVNGHAVALSNGVWSTTLTLAPGANAITAVASDGAGNSATATSSVTYAPPKKTTTPPPPATVKCQVPSLKGKKLAAAKKALRKAHCRLGKVKRAKSRKVKKGRVISSKPKAHTSHKKDAKVGVTLSKGKH